jgi:hypothetical protein
MVGDAFYVDKHHRFSLFFNENTLCMLTDEEQISLSKKRTMIMHKLFDMIVIGGGGSGLAAGVSAAQNGASVILFEKRPKLGGSTVIAIGSFTANRTIYQDKEGIEDSPEDHEADAGLFGQSDI